MQSRQERVDEAMRRFKKALDDINQHLMSRMRAAGYDVSEGGVCNGMAGMAMQAWLLSGYDGIKQLDDRLKLLLAMKEQDFVKAKQRNERSAPSRPSYYLFQNPNADIEQYQEIDAFFDGIQSYQEGSKVLHSVVKEKRQSPLYVAPHIFPKTLQERGNLVLAHSFSDAYQQEELVACLEKVKEAQKNHPNQRMAFRLISGGHGMFLGYDIQRDIWIVVDSNVMFFPQIKDCAESIMGGFSPNKANEVMDYSPLQRRLGDPLDLESVREELQSQGIARISLRNGPFHIDYQPNTNQFILINPKPAQYAVFTTEIYTISSIQSKLESRLQKLTSSPDAKEEKSTPSEKTINITLKHLEHTVRIQYDRETKTWVLLRQNNGKPCGSTPNIAQITQWVMSEFLTSTAHSIMQIDIEHNNHPSISVQDPAIVTLVNALSVNPGIWSPTINQEKAQRCDTYGASLLDCVAREGRAEMVSQLLASGAVPSSSALCKAASYGWIEVVDLLLQHGARDDTALINAVVYGNIGIVNKFLEHGSQINEQGNAKTTPLVAAAQNGNMPLVQFLLSKGADINTPDSGSFTPLSIAVERGHLEMVKFLLSKGATTVPGLHGQTLLHIAAYWGKFDMVAFLLSNNGEVNAGDNQGRTPFLYAASNNGEVNAGDNQGRTPFLYAAQNGHLKIMQLLLDHGALILPTPENFTPLMAAAQHGQLEVVRFLLARPETAVNDITSEGNGALYYAAMNGHAEVVSELLLRGAKKSITSAAIAKTNGHTEVCFLLLEAIKASYAPKIKELESAERTLLLEVAGVKGSKTFQESAKSAVENKVVTLENQQKNATKLSIFLTSLTVVAAAVILFLAPALILPTLLIAGTVVTTTWFSKLIYSMRSKPTINKLTEQVQQFSVEIGKLANTLAALHGKQKELVKAQQVMGQVVAYATKALETLPPFQKSISLPPEGRHSLEEKEAKNVHPTPQPGR